MYRFLLRPKWILFHVVVIAAIVLMINLGFWQLRRLDQRQAFNATVEARYDLPPEPLDEVLTAGTDPADVEWRQVTVSGTYVPDETIIVVNRSQNGSAGRNVAVPLVLDDGRVVVVNRGFVPFAVEEIPPVPAEEVAVVGRLRESEVRRTGQLSDPADGVLVEVQRLDLPRLESQLPGEVVPMYVDLVESNPAEVDGYPQPIAPPTLSEGNHLSYAFQWFIFSVAVAVGWVLAVRHSVRSRRAEELAPAAEPAEPVDQPV
ncbi:MAG: SURF1 family protein [Ilumatobacteraceae bacterium]